MRIDLNPEDLKPEFKDLSAWQVKFEHLNTDAQKATLAAGRATFWSWDRQTHDAVYPPKE
jgi:hypothetical protein